MIPVATELTGAITGGWEFVWGAYGLTWATFILYTISLIIRSPKEEA